MSTATTVEATAVRTIEWLSADATRIVVPVYQRQYRWDIARCERLLADIRAVAAAGEGESHFLGSILSAKQSASKDRELVLIDGQQRITTLLLLIAALQHMLRDSEPVVAAHLMRMLVRGDDPQRTKLRPHDAWADVFEAVVHGRGDATRESRFDDNYAFFRSQIQPSEALAIWRGLQRLEHVSITLGAQANAQQLFESLNSTGEPLRDDELIHNYILMGLSHAEQLAIEEEFWLPIERATGEAIGMFWRHYLVMMTGREVAARGEHGVYAAFRRAFPRLDLAAVRAHAASWRSYAEIYRVLLDPGQEADSDIRQQLAGINTFGRNASPLVMGSYHDYLSGSTDKTALIQTLEWVQGMYLRRTLAALPLDRLIARLARARDRGPDALQRAIARITPSDERIRAVLKYAELPYPAYVLGRLLGVAEVEGLDVEHIVPLFPSEEWSADGIRSWSELSEDEQNSYRTLAPTLGNLTLLEQPLAERMFGVSFLEKRAGGYARSSVFGTGVLANHSAWSTAQILERTVALSEDLLRIWARPPLPEIDDDGLTPVLDAVRRRGWPAGWEQEFDYVEYRGEHWEIKDVRQLFNRVFRRAWTDDRTSALAYSARNGGPIYGEKAWNGHWDDIGDGHHLYMGWDANYMMGALQGVLLESGIASEVFVKYSYIGVVM